MNDRRDLVDEVRHQLVAAGRPASGQNVYAALRSERRVVDSVGLLSLVDEVRSDLDGLGPLDAWVSTPGVTDVLVNGPDEVWVDRGEGLERTTTRFRDEAALRRLVRRVVSTAGRRIDDASPYVDVQLPGGLRLHAVLPPLSKRLCLSIRVPRQTGFTMDELVRNATVVPEMSNVLHDLVSRRLAFLVSGGTGSGKTTVLATLLQLVDPKHRMVVVEDTTELSPAHPHLVQLQARVANVEGAGSVTMRDLVRQALRMRPDRIVVGEARGAEVVDLLAALNTGHEGGCGTIHANASSDVPARIEALAATAGLDRAAAHSQLVSAIDAVVHLTRRADGSRYVQRVDVLSRSGSGWVETAPAWLVTADGRVDVGAGLPRWRELTATAA